MSAANAQTAAEETVPALSVPVEEERSNEMSFMDAMAVYMGMEVPKNRDPVAEAEAALAFLDTLWLICKSGEREPTDDLLIGQERGEYSRAAKGLQDEAFVSVTSAKRGRAHVQPLNACSPQQPGGQLSGLSEIGAEPHTLGSFVGTDHDGQDGEQAHAGADPDSNVHSDGQPDAVMQEVIKLLSQKIDQHFEDDIHLDRQQPLLSQLISSVSPFASDYQFPQFISKEKHIAAGLMARSIRARKESEQMLAAEAAKASVELKMSEDSRRDALAKLRHAAHGVQASLAVCKMSMNTIKQSNAILSLKAKINDLFKCMKDRVSMHQTKMAGKKRHDAETAKVLLANGENPYEVQRQVLRASLKKRQRRHMEQVISTGKERILKQLLHEQHAWSQELKDAMHKQDHEQAFQREMGGAALEDKVDQYMLKTTKDKVEMLDPTGRRPIFPSQAIARKALKVSELPVPVHQPELRNGFGLPKSVDQMDLASTHVFQGSWAVGHCAVGGSDTSQPSNICKEHAVLQQGENAKMAGCSGSSRTALFIADPPEVLFQDFEPGTAYRVSIKLTNTSVQRATCRALDIAASVADVLELEMEPPGFLSSGMSCHVHLTFKPKLNEDVDTQITLLTNCGTMIVPVTCLRKRANLKLSVSLIEFGSCIVGDKRTQTLELQNSGALQVKYCVTGSVIAASSAATGYVEAVSEPQCDQTVTVNNKANLLQVGPFKLSHQQGLCAGHNSVLIQAVFEPFIVQQSEAVLEVLCKPLGRCDEPDQKFVVHIQGTCTDLPVKADTEVLDFKTCMVGKTYRGEIRVQNSSHIAMKAHISAPLCTAGSLSLTPSYGFVQGLGELPFSIDFCPTASTLEQCRKFSSADNLTIELPISVNVPDQPFPLKIWVKATITEQLLQFSSFNYDLGTCNVNECTVCPVVIRNPTALEQTFAFTGMPPDVCVQDSPGCIPPNGRVEAKVFITPRVAGLRSFTLQVQSLCLSVARLSFTAAVTEPQLTLSHNLVKLKATTFSGITSASIMLHNHAGSRKRFAFGKLNSSELSITPAFGCISGGGSVRLQIDYAPKGNKILPSMALHDTRNDPSEGPDGQKPVGDSPHRHDSSNVRPPASPMAHALTCYSSSDDRVACDPAFTSLEVHTCEVAPSAILVGTVVDPCSARYVCDFGVLPVGTSKQKNVTLRNMTSDDLVFKFKATNPFGPFEQVTACPWVRGMDSTLLRLQFKPKSGGIFRELLQVAAGPLILLCELHGAAEEPEWQINLQDIPADLSSLPGSSSPASMQLQNPCQFPVACSLAMSRHSVCNIGNCPPFILHPGSMRVASGGFIDISMNYRPDWQGPHFDQSINIVDPCGSKDVVLHGSMLAGSLLIRGGRSSCAGLRLPPTLAPEYSRLNDAKDGFVGFPKSSWGEQQSTEIMLKNINPPNSSGEMKVSFQQLTTEEQAMGWHFQPMEVSIGPGETKPVIVSLQLPDDAPEACAGTLGLTECFSVSLTGSVTDCDTPPDTSTAFTLTIRTDLIACKV